MNNLKGKRILVTQYALAELSGSEIVTLELVSDFVNQGAHVTLYTLRFDDPIAYFFRELPKDQLTIIARSDVSVSFSDFDYVWVHHQILPVSMVEELSSKTILPPIIFNHMSSYIPIEQPYLFDMERSIASFSLFNSQETLDNSAPYFKPSLNYPFIVFPNPSPKKFTNYISARKKADEKPNKILIVSNHIPDEIQDVMNLMKTQGIQVDIVGRPGIVQLVTPELLDDYDLIITIGKTVQYCLVMATPVYCYDHFGGPGYLNSKNIKKASYHNFSGRGFTKKTPHTIYSEIMSGYKDSLDYLNNNLTAFRQQYDIGEYFHDIFAQKHRAFKPLPLYQVNSYKSAQLLVSQYVNIAYDALRKDKEYNLAIDELKLGIAELKSQNLQLNNTLNRIKRTLLYRIYRKIIQPLRDIRSYFK